MNRSSSKTPTERAFLHYLRTGLRLREEVFLEEHEIERKFNPYHDLRNGQFTFAPGGTPTGKHAPGHGRPRGSANPNTYIVRKGDTLSHIARRHGIGEDVLATVNGVRNPDRIRAGQTLSIPQSAPHPAQSPTRPKAKSTARSGEKILVVGNKRPEVSAPIRPTTRLWPVVGDGKPAKKGAIGPNGKTYSDGRYDPSGTSRNGRPHYGIDLPAKPGDRVRAAAGGNIYYVGAIPGYGKTVAILHPDGTVSMYAHLDKFGAVAIGEPVAKGDTVGVVGNSGNAVGRGTHLHFEVRKFIGRNTLGRVSSGAQPIDPTKWVLGT